MEGNNFGITINFDIFKLLTKHILCTRTSGQPNFHCTSDVHTSTRRLFVYMFENIAYTQITDEEIQRNMAMRIGVVFYKEGACGKKCL